MNNRWDWNGPEEGDEIDLTVVIMFDGDEVIEIAEDKGSVQERKQMAERICIMLNVAEASPL